MRFAAAAAALSTVALSTIACSATPPPATAPFSVPSATAPSPTAVVYTPEEEAIFGPRVELPGGMLQKQLGKVFQWGGPEDTDMNTYGMRMVIDKITVDPKCDPYFPKPERGHRLLLTVRVETSQYLQPGELGPFYHDFSTIGPDGVTEGPMSSNSPCHQATALPIEVRPSSKYRGEITLDTANTAGKLVFGSGALWNYPA